MELMELVENEPTTRPFQCDWQSCTKVRHPAISGPDREVTDSKDYRASTENLICKDISEYTQMRDHTPV